MGASSVDLLGVLAIVDLAELFLDRDSVAGLWTRTTDIVCTFDKVLA